MDNKTARQLVALNNRFYAEHAASFSATRGAPWAGWQRVVQLFEEHLLAHPQGRSASVADLACGNLRFEAYCEQQLERLDPTYHAVDACPDLLAHASALRCAARIRPGSSTSSTRCWPDAILPKRLPCRPATWP